MTRSSGSRQAGWASLLAVLLLFAGGVSFFHRVGVTEPVVGVTWLQSSSGPVALSVEESGVAWRAGLRVGDLLLAVDGTPVDSAVDAAELGWWSEAGAPVRLKVQRGVSSLLLEILPQRAPRSEPYTYVAIAGLAFWVSGLFVALRWPSVRGGLLYAMLSFCFFGQLTLSHTGRAGALDWSVYWGDVLCEALAPALMLHLAVALSKRTLRRPRWTIASAYAISAALVLAAIWLSPAALGGAYHFRNPVLAVEIRDRLVPLFLGLALLFAVTLLVKSYQRSSSAMHRSQMRWLLWGAALGLGPYVTFYAFPWSLGAPELPSWAQFVSVVPLLFVPAAFTAALARHRLHDLDLILLRGFAEVTAVFAVFGIYAATVFLVREAIGEVVPLSRSAARYLGLLVMIVAYPRVRVWVRRGVDRAFYSQRYSYRATLLDWARELSAETDLYSLLHHLHSRIRETLDVGHAEALLWDGERSFESISTGGAARTLELDEASRKQLEAGAYIDVVPGSLPGLPWARYLFSMKVKGRLRAVLAVAERRQPEEPLNSEDRALLITVAAHAATAIEAARLVLEVRRRAEEIERLHARQAKILESSAVGLLLLDAECRIQAWNRALEEIYGLPREQALGRRLSEVLPLQVARRIGRRIRRGPLADEGRIFRLNMVNRRGERLVANLAISPVDGSDESEGSSVVTFDDVTERVKLEEQVLRQERLASLGLLAAGVAHEINTPLTGISSYAQMLIEESPEGDPRLEILSKIEKQTARASRITNSLLNIARPERAVLRELDINETIQEVLQLFEPQVRGRAVKLHADLATDLPMIPGHKAKLQQVLLNLLLNARDAVDDQGRITIRSARGARHVVVEVLDDGIGIAEEDLQSIFDPFFTTKARGQGTGLGLSISYGIVQEHAGEFHVESRPGELTRFRIELPVASTARAMA